MINFFQWIFDEKIVKCKDTRRHPFAGWKSLTMNQELKHLLNSLLRFCFGFPTSPLPNHSKMIAEPAAAPQGRLRLKTLTRSLTTVISFQSQAGPGCRVSRALHWVTRAFVQKEQEDCANKAKPRAAKMIAATYLALKIFPFWYSKIRFEALKLLFLLRTIHLFYFSSHFFPFNVSIVTVWVSSRGISSGKGQAITREREGISVCDSQTGWQASRIALPSTEAKSKKSLLFTTFTYMCVTSIESLWYIFTELLDPDLQEKMREKLSCIEIKCWCLM